MIFRLADPWMLALLLLPLLVLLLRPRRGGAAFGAYTIAAIAVRRSQLPLLWRILMAGGLSALVIAAARPQYGRTVDIHEAKGRDLVLVIDLSLSMIADDMFDEAGNRVDRLRAVVDAAERFIEGRPNDRIGVVFFADHSLTACPLTFDHHTAIEFLRETEERQRLFWNRYIKMGGRGDSAGILGNGTNLGLGIGEALRHLQGERDSEGRALVLITDGKDSRELSNWVDPLESARYAKVLDCSVYAIGVGDSDGQMSDPRSLFQYGTRHFIPVRNQWLPSMQRLQAIVAAAGTGLAREANDREGLIEILNRINELEPSSHEVRQVDDFKDQYPWPLALGLLLLGFAWLMEPRLRGVP